MYTRFLYITVVLLNFTFLNAQTKILQLSLSEVVALAQSDAPDVLIANTRLNNSYWRYKSFLADYKPQINLDAQLPNLNHRLQLQEERYSLLPI